jgi:NTE family protein
MSLNVWPFGRDEPEPATRTTDRGDLALVLTGGGARGAYQVGFLRYLSRHYPELRIPILSGISAGAINTVLLAQHHGTFAQATAELAGLWGELTPERIFRVDVRSLLANVGRWGMRLTAAHDVRTRGLVDTTPLWHLMEEVLGPVGGELTGIDYNLERGTLRAAAVSTTDYNTGRTVVFVQGREIETWERPQRISQQTRLGVQHVMASAALPLFFPAVRVGTHWYGDGGIRLTSPLSPALHLGAHKILAVSTRFQPTVAEAAVPEVYGYPPPAQILSVLYNAIFLDMVDQDATRMERMNQVLRKLPEERLDGMRVVDLLVVRPSQDLGQLAVECEPQLPRAFRMLTRGLGTRETRSSDMLSLLMFQRDYAEALMQMGERDAEARHPEIEAFLRGCPGGAEAE